MLHIVNKSPLERNTLDTCIATAQPDDALILIEDAVYAANSGNAGAAKLNEAKSKGFKLYALQPDLEARGIADRVIDGVTLVDYEGFVDLVAAESSSQSWL